MRRDLRASEQHRQPQAAFYFMQRQLCQFVRSLASPAQQRLRDADSALYVAKRDGRNCVKLHEGDGN